MNTSYHGIRKFLISLLNPLTQDEYDVNNFFEATGKINSVSFEDISEEFIFVTFDVKSLFTSVPLKKIIEIILNMLCTC